MKKRPLFTLCVVWMCVAVWMAGRVKYRDLAGEDRFEISNVTLTGTIADKSRRKDGFTYYMKDGTLTTPCKRSPVTIQGILIYVKDDKSLPIGEQIQTRGKMKQMGKERNPGGFDAYTYYKNRGVSCAFFPKEMVHLPSSFTLYDKIKEELFRVKYRWGNVLLEYLGEDKGGIVCAILLGEKSFLQENNKRLYQQSGIGHILAISGLHISFIGGGVYSFLRRRGCDFVLAGSIGMGMLLFYMAIIGRTVSIVRAVVMLGIKMGADVCGRVYDSWTALGVAGVVCTVLFQGQVLEPGFWLSFGAVLALFLWQKVIAVRNEKVHRQKEKNSIVFRWKKTLINSFMCSQAICLLLLPITRNSFYEVPIYSAFVNMLVLPFMGPLLFLAMGGSVGSIFFPPFAKICFAAVSIILRWFEMVAEKSLQVPGASLIVGKMPLIQVVCFLGATLCWSIFFVRKKPRHHQAMLLCLCIVLGMGKVPKEVPLRITMLDVGQGDGLLVEGPRGKHYLIDGGSSDIPSLYTYHLEPCLKSKGIHTVDYAIISHGDADHYSGIKEMLEKESAIRLKTLVFGHGWKSDENLVKLWKLAKKRNVRLLEMVPGDCIKEGKMTFSYLGPWTQAIYSANEKSAVFSLVYGEFSMLFTGDLEKRGERSFCEMAKNKGLSAHTVLKVAHHGGKNSGSNELIKMISPQVSLISAGYNNSYGHPHKETLRRLQDSAIFCTKWQGALIVKTDGKSYQVITWRKKSLS